MGFTSEDLFGDFSDLEGFSDDESFSAKGRQLYKKLSTSESKYNSGSRNVPKKDTWKSKNSNVSNAGNSRENENVIREVYSGIRMVNPLVSSDELRTLMEGRRMVKLSSLRANINKTSNDVDGDWVTIGVITNKMSKVSKNGNEYSLWKLSDLKSDKVASLFLFGKVHDKLWKLPSGAVIGLLNASIMSDSEKDSKYKNNEIGSLTLDDPDKLLHLGTSKDMGYCKALKKNGDVCGNLITKSEDEFCLYHIKNAYRKFSSKRPEIQSNYSNKEPEDYHFANNFTPNVGLNERNIVVEMKTINKTQLEKKKEVESQKIKKFLENPLSRAAQTFSQSSRKPSTKTSTSPPSEGYVSAKEVFSKLKLNNSQSTPVPSQPKPPPSSSKPEIPTLARGYKRGQMVDLHATSSKSLSVSSDITLNLAKRRAIEIFKNKPSPSPVVTPSAKSKKLQAILKRVDQSLTESNEELKKEQEAEADKKKKLIEAALQRKSINDASVDAVECRATEKYFKKLETKERYESRLSDVKEIKVKAVTCNECKYTAVGQSDMCKAKNHSVVFHQATKKFFACKHCKNRTFTLDSMLPARECKTCGNNSWGKSAIINVKTETKLGKDLLVRGEEIKFL